MKDCFNQLVHVHVQVQQVPLCFGISCIKRDMSVGKLLSNSFSTMSQLKFLIASSEFLRIELCSIELNAFISDLILIPI